MVAFYDNLIFGIPELVFEPTFYYNIIKVGLDVVLSIADFVVQYDLVVHNHTGKWLLFTHRVAHI